MKHLFMAGWLALVSSLASAQPTYDSIIGDSLRVGGPDAHWFALQGRQIAYLVDGDAGSVAGTLTLSMFSPALEPHPPTTPRSNCWSR